MLKRHWMKWLVLLALIIPLVLTACGGGTVPEAEEPAVEETVPEEVEEVEEPVEEAEEPVEEPTEEPMEEPTEEAMEEEPTEEPMEEEPTEEPMEETGVSASMMGIDECTVAEDGPFAGVDPSGQSVVWWHNHSGSREEQLAVLVEQFNESNACGITVEALNQGSYDDIRNQVNASISAGDLPAALVVGYQNDQAFYQLNNALVDLEPYLQDAHWGLGAEDQSDFYASFFDQSIHPLFDNQRLGFPPNRSMEVLFYNQTWLEELGFDGPPATPEEFQEMACAGAEANGDGTGGYILREDASAVAAWTYAFGGDVLNEEGSGYVYDGDATVQSMAFLKALYDDGCAYLFTEGFPNPEFAARRAIFAQGSSSGIPFYAGDVATISEEEGREPDEWGVAAIPHTTAEPVQNIYGGDIMITNTTPEQQLAGWIFVKWFTLPDIQAEWDVISGYFPTRLGATEFLEGYVDENPQWGQAIELLPYSYYEPQLISYTGVRDAAQAAFNEIMQLPAGASEEDIRAILTNLTEVANEQQEELMSELE
jgi:multiple sugar transport system substrate-binding protein/sn-glycerol 3-phosphate transport system substrate-binding protein